MLHHQCQCLGDSEQYEPIPILFGGFMYILLLNLRLDVLINENSIRIPGYGHFDTAI
jgi:hypothetical protein